MAPSPAERLLQELGITEPKEIDLHAIAYYVGARIRLRPLDGCEAHILGCDDQALITIKADSSPRRKRFSIVHELGHWRDHRGKSLVCRADEYRPREAEPAMSARLASFDRKQTKLTPGTVLVREWDRRSHRVMVVADGFAWDGQTYDSLTKVAFAITGTKWNGPRFFGLRDKQDRLATETRP